MTIDTARLRALAEAAEPGIWPTAREWEGPGVKVDARDAVYIAAADPLTVLALLDEIERLRDTLARILGYTRGAVRRLMPEELAELERERRSDD